MDRGAWWGRKELDMTEHTHQMYMFSLPCCYVKVLSLSLKILKNLNFERKAEVKF